MNEPIDSRDSYYQWLLGLLIDNDQRMNCTKERLDEFRDVLSTLFEEPFSYILPLDENRAIDGVAMRDKYAYAKGIDEYPNLSGACNMLEMLIALACRCENDIMGSDPDANHSAYWFWCMLNNCGLLEYGGKNFDKEKVVEIINNIRDRKYEKDGTGGLFRMTEQVIDYYVDMRDKDIWHQMCLWLLDNFDDEWAENIKENEPKTVKMP